MNKVFLKDVCLNITDGEHGSIKDDKAGNYYYLSNKNIIDNRIIFNSKDRKINKTTFDKINKRTKLEKNDLLLSTVGTIGKTVIIKDEPNFTFQRSVGIIKVDSEKIDPYYVKYYLDNTVNQKKLNQIANGGVQKGLYISDLGNLEINVPDLLSQKNIVNILKTIDDKIEVNLKIIEKLNVLIDLIYKNCFLQYNDPSNCDSNYKLIWNDEMKINIPEDWCVKRLIEIEDKIITGKTPSTKDKENFNGEIPFITIDDLRKGDFVFSTVRTLSKKGADMQKNKYLPENSICVSCIATVGEVGLTTVPSQTNQQINTIICNEEYNIYYLYNYLKNYFSLNNSAKSGNIFKNMNKDDFSNIKVIYPSVDLLKRFDSMVSTYYEKIKNSQKENVVLSNYRDYILPLLINAQIRTQN